MAQSPDVHFKLMFGELAAQLALVRAENDELRDALAAAQKQPKRATPAKP